MLGFEECPDVAVKTLPITANRIESGDPFSF